MTYHQQIKHPNWQKKRLEVLSANGFACQNCGSKDQELNVHHPFYKRGAMVWEYDTDDLQCLCNVCHKNEHARDEKIKKEIAYLQIDKDELLGWLKAANDNPYIRLESFEEISGYLNHYGINGKQKDLVADEIIKASGDPELAFPGTHMCDIAAACTKQHSDVQVLWQAAIKITQKRLNKANL